MNRLISRSISSTTSFSNVDDERELLLNGSNGKSYGSETKRQLSEYFKTDPVTLTFENLNVFVPLKRRIFDKFKKRKNDVEQPKQILRNVTGVVCPGQLVALMGASGSGKTTLLNVITSRNCSGLAVDGLVKVNGEELHREITSISAYVQQDDMFIGTMTVREHLIFQAMLRLPNSMSRVEKIYRVDQVIFELGLRKCQNTKIGVQGVIKGISGGEAKRLAFASEILHDPPLMFCDEPTTGLDSYMAQSVVAVLQNMANKGKTVVCTIHQPASEIYAMFDRILFLAEGRVAYFGASEGALDFFQENGFPCPEDFNPADFFIQTLAVVPGKEAECRPAIEKICDNYSKSEYKRKVDDLVTKSQLSTSKLELDVDRSRSPYHTTEADNPPAGKCRVVCFVKENRKINVSSDGYKAGNFVQFTVLLWRSMINNFRNSQIFLVKFISKIVMAIFVGLIYLNTTNNQEGIMNINGGLFFILGEYTFPALYGVLTILPLEFPILVREHHNGLYRIATYYIPTYTLDGITFITICYFMVGFQRTASAFFWTLFIGALIQQTSCAFGVMLSAISPSFPIALTISGPILTVIEMAGGLFTNVGTIPVYLAWSQYLSWFRYGFEAMSIVQWEHVTNITCETPELSCVTNGQTVLNNLSFNVDNFGMDVGLLVVLFVAFHFIGFLGLWFRTYLAR